MRYSKRLQRQVDMLSNYYTAALIAGALAGAEAHARARGGREITPEDWDAATDECSQPAATGNGVTPGEGERE